MPYHCYIRPLGQPLYCQPHCWQPHLQPRTTCLTGQGLTCRKGRQAHLQYSHVQVAAEAVQQASGKPVA
jgi:hypothetical protein